MNSDDKIILFGVAFLLAIALIILCIFSYHSAQDQKAYYQKARENCSQILVQLSETNEYACVPGHIISR